MSKNGNLVNWPGREWDVGAAGPLLRLAADLGEDDWRWGAACATVDPELFFPIKGGSTREAKAVCGDCPVRTSCLEDAMEHNDRFGILGGLTVRERDRFRRQRARQQVAA